MSTLLRLPSPRPRAATPPRVLLVTPPNGPTSSGAPDAPGAGTDVLARCLAAGSRSYRYRLTGGIRGAAPGVGGRVEPRGVRAGRWANARLLARLATPDRCALHHLFFSPQPGTARTLRMLRRLTGRPLIHTVPSPPDPTQLPASLVFADRTVALSQASALWLRSAEIGPVEVIRPGVPLPPAPLDRERARRRLALEGSHLDLGNAPTLLYPGDLEGSDGAEVFVEAAARLVERIPEARFVLACRAKDGRHDARRRALLERIRAHGLAERTVLLGRSPDMEGLLSAVDVAVLPVSTLRAKVEPPLALLEAMARGTPGVVSDLPQLAELAGLGEGVRVVPRRDPDALSEVLAGLLETSSLLERMGRGARHTIREHFRPDRMVAAYEALYTELLASS